MQDNRFFSGCAIGSGLGVVLWAIIIILIAKLLKVF